MTDENLLSYLKGVNISDGNARKYVQIFSKNDIDSVELLRSFPYARLSELGVSSGDYQKIKGPNIDKIKNDVEKIQRNFGYLVETASRSILSHHFGQRYVLSVRINSLNDLVHIYSKTGSSFGVRRTLLVNQVKKLVPQYAPDLIQHAVKNNAIDQSYLEDIKQWNHLSDDEKLSKLEEVIANIKNPPYEKNRELRQKVNDSLAECQTYMHEQQVMRKKVEGLRKTADESWYDCLDYWLSQADDKLVNEPLGLQILTLFATKGEEFHRELEVDFKGSVEWIGHNPLVRLAEVKASSNDLAKARSQIKCRLLSITYALSVFEETIKEITADGKIFISGEKLSNQVKKPKCEDHEHDFGDRKVLVRLATETLELGTVLTS